MRKLVPLLIASAAVAIPSGAHAAAVGINVPGGAASYVNAAAAAATGAKTARIFVNYPGGSNPGAALNDYQIVVNSFVGVGLKPVFTVAPLDHSGASNLDPEAYATYISTMAKQYGANVAAWEVWNEPDEAEFWGKAGGDPVQYAALLKAVYPKMPRSTKVFVGGLVGNNYDFLAKVYQAGAKGSFDGVATHTDTACSIVGPDSFYKDPNGAISRWSFLGIKSVRDVMVANGDADKPIWITELGWNTSSGLCDSGMWAGQKNAGVTAAEQAEFLGMAWHCLKDYPYVENAQWFNLQDEGTGSKETYGLKTVGGAAKPALAAFQAVAAGQDLHAGKPCGDFAGPTISVASPGAGSSSPVGKALSISVSAADPQGVGRITLLVDGVKLRNFTNKGVTDPKLWPKTLPGAMDWMGGKKLKAGAHTLTVIAIDGSGNQTTQTVPFTKAKAKAKAKAKKKKR